MVLRFSFLTMSLLLALFGCSAQDAVVSYPTEVIAPIDAPFPMPALVRPTFPDKVFDIRQFGAVEGGTVKNTTAIRSAIAKAASEGGGHVLIPRGTWLTGAIHFENTIDLHLAEGAVLLFSQDFEDYLPVVFSRHEDVECYKHSAFLYANGKTNIAITGTGTLNGQGKPWWKFKTGANSLDSVVHRMGAEDVPVEQRVFDGTDERVLRPAFFQPMNCTNVLVEGVTFKYGAFWTITPTYCENVIVRRVRIETEGEYGHTPNGDGVDPSSCRNVLIEHCEFDTGDDCIAIKSGRDRDGRRVGKPTENIIVRHCVGLRGHGGIVIGSESSGDVRNVYGYDCTFNGTDRIVRVKTARGRGGVIENLWFKDLRADTIEQQAVHLNMLYTGTKLRLPQQAVDETTPRIRNVHIENITCGYGKSNAVEILGLPEMNVEHITFKGLRMSAAKGINLQDVRNIRFENIEITPDKGPLVTITDAKDVVLDAVAVPEGMNPVVKASGEMTENVVFTRTDTRSAKKVLSAGKEVKNNAVKFE